MKKNLYIVVGIILAVISAFSVGTLVYKTRLPSGEVFESSIFIRDHSPSLGPTIAKVVVVEFLDPECESCRAMHPVFKTVLKEYENRIRYVVRYMSFHKNSAVAIKWLEAAGKQGKYWEALESLFESQPIWGDHHNPRPDLIPQFATRVGVDKALAETEIKNPAYDALIQQDREDAQKLGVKATPTIFVNGKMLQELGYNPLVQLIENELK